MRLDQSKPAAVAHAALAAEAVTRSLVGRTVAEVERDLILRPSHRLGNRTHAANILGIRSARCATSSTNTGRGRAGPGAERRRGARRGVTAPFRHCRPSDHGAF